MICRACRKQRHEDCPNVHAAPSSVELRSKPSKKAYHKIEAELPPTGLSPEGDAIQRSGLCPCHHRAAK